MKQLCCLLLLVLPGLALAEPGVLPMVTVAANANGTETYSLSIQILLAMTFLTLLPAALLMLTSFTRIVIILSILRQAMGMPTTPTNQVLIGLSLLLSLFIMTPVIDKIHDTAIGPYLAEQITPMEALKRAEVPLRDFMLNQTRNNDLDLFKRLSGHEKTQDVNKLPFTVLMPAFITSELKTAFQIGFLLFLPFLIIDLVVASVLMSMGMMMLSPLIVSLPFKLMLFVLVDGWTLVLGTLAASFGV